VSPGPSKGDSGRQSPARCPHCGGPGTGDAADGLGDVRHEYVEEDEEDLTRDADDPRWERGRSAETKRSDQPAGADREPCRASDRVEEECLVTLYW
jgi:hypothetical protein